MLTLQLNWGDHLAPRPCLALHSDASTERFFTLDTSRSEESSGAAQRVGASF